MATTTATVAGVQMIALSEIRHDQNVRQELVAEEVDALAQSIALLGQLVPVSVRPDTENGGYVLIAGHKRYAALAQLGHTEIRAEVRPDGESEAAERAAENVVRSSLNPYEEAIAVQGDARARAERGRRRAGARLAQAARHRACQAARAARAGAAADRPGRDPAFRHRAAAQHWPREPGAARRGDRLPRRRQRVGGRAPGPRAGVGDRLRAAQQLSARCSPPTWPSSTATRSPICGSARRPRLCSRRPPRSHKQLDRYAYGAPSIRFSESDVDQARAAGVLVEFENARPIIVDRSLYRELSKQAIKRTVEELRARVAEVAQSGRPPRRPAGRSIPRPRRRGSDGRTARDRGAGARREPRSRRGLINGLATVDPADMTVARFFALCRRRHRTNYADVATMPRGCRGCWRRVRRRASGGAAVRDCRHSQPRLSR